MLVRESCGAKFAKGICAVVAACALVMAAVPVDAIAGSSASAAYAGQQQELKENSWRYSNGQRRVVTQPGFQDAKASGASASKAWSKTSSGVLNSYGTLIPDSKTKVIDISEHNGSIDWAKVKKSDIDAVIIRCGYGSDYESQDDKWWERNVSECERLGIPYGVYLYSYALNVSMAKSEAQHTIRLLKKGNHKPALPVYYDLEDEIQDGFSRTKLADMAEQYCTSIEAAGYRAGVYANLYWFNNKLTDARFSRWTKWVAQYNYQCEYKKPYDLWQCSSTATTPGVSGNVDMNVGFGRLLGNYKPSQTIRTSKSTYDAKIGKTFSLRATSKTARTYKSSNTKIATVDSKGKVTPKRMGTCYVTVKAEGSAKYKAASKRVKISVRPLETKLSSRKGVRGGLSVKWKRVDHKNASGYQVRYSRYKSMKRSLTRKAPGYKSKSKQFKVSQPGKRYYVQVRVYKNANGRVYHSKWSTPKSVVTKKKR